jgi:DNA polymerase-3 subunit delta'
MGFDKLLGNHRLRENLKNSVSRGKLSHFYLISGPRGSGKKTLARLIGAAAVCQGEHKPCLTCDHCRKVMADTHPDFITVVDPDHKAVSVKMVREYREDIFIRPNEAEKKVYMFPQELRNEGYNALLKVLEEPPSYGVFMLLTDNPEKILPTIRSRCTELNLLPLAAGDLLPVLRQAHPDATEDTLSAALDRSGGYLGQALELMTQGMEADSQTKGFLAGMTHRDVIALQQTLVSMEKWKRDQLLPILNRWAEILQQALICRSGSKVLSEAARQMSSQRSGQELLEALRCIQKAIEYTQGNVSVAAICGWLSWALR